MTSVTTNESLGGILTIGHSNHPLEQFLGLLERTGVETIADVRSAPISRFFPHFNRAALAAALSARGIGYEFLGEELGGRPKEAGLFTGDVADYEKMAAMPSFLAGIHRLIALSQHSRVAAMCSEADPLDCHRCLLVGRALTGRGLSVGHILRSGRIVAQTEIETQLLGLAGLDSSDLLSSRDERVREAYLARSRKAAFTRKRAPR